MSQESPHRGRTSTATATRVGYGLAVTVATACAFVAWYSDRASAFSTFWIFAWIAVVHLPTPRNESKSAPALALAWGALPPILLAFGGYILAGLQSFPLTDLSWSLPRQSALSVPLDRLWTSGFFLISFVFALVARWMSQAHTAAEASGAAKAAPLHPPRTPHDTPALTNHTRESESRSTVSFLLCARWLHLGAWVAIALALSRLLSWLSYPQLENWLAPVLRWIVVILAIEMFARGLLEHFRGAHARDGRVVLADSTLLGFVAARLNPLGSIYAAARELFGIDVTGTVALQVVRRSLVPIALGAVALGWALTSVQMIETDEEGVWLRFGRLNSDSPLQPGLHLVAPWPIDSVKRVATGRIHSLSIGYKGQTAETSLLWTSRHAAEEYSLLLGDGNDLIAVNGLLNYRITDAYRYSFAYQNPRAALIAIADRVLLEQTHGASLDQVLSENLAELTARIEAAIREELERADLGLELNDLSLIGLHPPVDVATDYQDVNSSAILRETMRVEGETYAIETLPAANATAHRTVSEAASYQSTRLAQASGQAAAFEAVERGYRLSPRLFEFRAELEALERALENRTYYIIDDRIERDGGSLWLLD